MDSTFWLYILASRRHGTLYIGVTNDLARRVFEHREGLIPGFTQRYGVKQLVFAHPYSSIDEARAAEHSMKRWRRSWKIQLIERDNPDWRDLYPELNR
jgi:putative endonuclease